LQNITYIGISNKSFLWYVYTSKTVNRSGLIHQNFLS